VGHNSLVYSNTLAAGWRQEHQQIYRFRGRDLFLQPHPEAVNRLHRTATLISRMEEYHQHAFCLQHHSSLASDEGHTNGAPIRQTTPLGALAPRLDVSHSHYCQEQGHLDLRADE